MSANRPPRVDFRCFGCVLGVATKTKTQLSGVRMKNRNRSSIAVILASSGALASVNMNTLPAKDWKVHSGRAPVAGEDVHSLSSQKIAGTKNTVIKAESGAKLCVT